MLERSNPCRSLYESPLAIPLVRCRLRGELYMLHMHVTRLDESDLCSNVLRHVLCNG